MIRQKASEIIHKEKLSEPQVFIFRTGDGTCSLSPLEKVLEAADRLSGHDVVLLPGSALDADGPLVVDHLRYASPADVVSFHVTARGTIQSRKYTITEEGKEAIHSVLSVKIVLVPWSEAQHAAASGHSASRPDAGESTVGPAAAGAQAKDEAREACDVVLGKPYPGMPADNWGGLDPTIARGQFCLNVVMPHVTRQEIKAFNKQATFTAIREGTMLYLAASFGNHLALDSSYNVYKDSPEAMAVPLPSIEDLPDGEGPVLYCNLIDSATAMVKAIRKCCLPGFTRTWLAVVHEQRRAAYDERAEIKWATELLSRYPTPASLANHPHALTGTVRDIGGAERSRS